MDPLQSMSCSAGTATTSPANTSATNTTISPLESQVQALLASGLVADLTREYQQAMELIPRRVRQESRLSDFLRAEEYNVLRAATRVARYWKTRKWLFGDRWLLPMSQSGSGVLGPAEIQILRSGYIQIVQSPIHGTTLVTDFSLLPPGARRLQPEVIFYLFSICACDLTLLFVVRSGNRPEMVMTSHVKLTLLNSTAARVTKFFVAQAHEEGKEHLLDYYGFQDKILTEKTFQIPCAGHVANRSIKQTINALQNAGYARHNLPVALGGSLDRNHFDQWVRMRISIEDIMGASPLPAQPSLILPQHAAGAVTEPNHMADIPKRAQRQRESLSIVRKPNETEKEFAKRKNALYVRRNYHRQKLEIKAAEGEVAKCRMLHEQLTAENGRLIECLQQVKELVRAMENGDASGSDSSV